jgi:hypothetical protein
MEPKYGKEPNGMPAHQQAFSLTSGCLFICMEVLKPHVHYFFLLINNPEDCEILTNNLLQLVRLHEKFTEDRIHAHLPARGWRASYFKWKDTRAMGFWLP